MQANETLSISFLSLSHLLLKTKAKHKLIFKKATEQKQNKKHTSTYTILLIAPECKICIKVVS